MMTVAALTAASGVLVAVHLGRRRRGGQGADGEAAVPPQPIDADRAGRRP
jgi:hypothetical protein